MDRAYNLFEKSSQVRSKSPSPDVLTSEDDIQVWKLQNSCIALSSFWTRYLEEKLNKVSVKPAPLIMMNKIYNILFILNPKIVNFQFHFNQLVSVDTNVWESYQNFVFLKS